MKPNLEHGEALVANEDKFRDALFSRFSLRKGAAPFRLDEKVSEQWPIERAMATIKETLAEPCAAS